MFKPIQYLFFAAVVAIAGLSSLPAVGATPSSGTLSTTSVSIIYTDGPFTLSNPTGATGQAPTCSDPTTSPCSQFALTVSLPSGFVESRTGDTLIAMSLFVPGQDVYSVYLEDAAGNVLAYNTGIGATVASPITAFQYKAVNGSTKYKVVVVPTVSAGGNFTATLSLNVPPPKSDVAPGALPLYRLYSPTTKDHVIRTAPLPPMEPIQCIGCTTPLRNSICGRWIRTSPANWSNLAGSSRVLGTEPIRIRFAAQWHCIASRRPTAAHITCGLPTTTNT